MPHASTIKNMETLLFRRSSNKRAKSKKADIGLAPRDFGFLSSKQKPGETPRRVEIDHEL